MPPEDSSFSCVISQTWLSGISLCYQNILQSRLGNFSMQQNAGLVSQYAHFHRSTCLIELYDSSFLLLSKFWMKMMGSGCGCAFLTFCFTVCTLSYKLRLCTRDELALHPALPAVKPLWPLVPCWWGLSALGHPKPSQCYLSSAQSCVFSVSPSCLIFPHCHRGHRGHLYAGSNSETFWILFILLFDQWSHVTQADLKLYISWGWPSAPNPPAYTSQVLGLWV